jgi:hypothetical protein
MYNVPVGLIVVEIVPQDVVLEIGRLNSPVFNLVALLLEQREIVLFNVPVFYEAGHFGFLSCEDFT